MGEDRISEIINSPKNFLAEAYISHGLKVCRFHITTAKSAHLMGIAPGKYYTITTGRLNDIVETGDISDCLSELLTPLLEPFYGGKLCVCGIGNRNLAVDSLGPETVRRIPLMWLEEPAMKCRFSKVVAITPDVQTNTNINTAAIIRSVSNSISANCILAIDVEMCSHYEDLCATIHISDRGLKISNSGQNIDFDTVGIPVIAVSVPTLMPVDCLLEGEGTVDDLITVNYIEYIIKNAACIIARAIIQTICPGHVGAFYDKLIEIELI